MEAKWLEDFLSLAETRSFSRAASDRHLTQSALSRRIAALETWLDAKLIDRSVSPIRLTATGMVFRGQAAEILRGIYAARTLARAHELVTDGARVVRLSVVHTLLFTFLPHRLRKLKDDRRHLKTKVQAVNVPDGIHALIEGETDLLLAYHHAQLPIAVDADRFPFLSLGHERLIPVSAADARGNPSYRLPGDDEDPLPFMAYSAGTFLGNLVEMLMLNAHHGCSLQRTFETHMAEAVKAMVVAGNGIGWLPESCIARELHEKSVAVAGGDAWATNLEIRLYRAADNRSPAASELWDWMSRFGSA
jgi:DNA-binding transcriptional LysR family regulator